MNAQSFNLEYCFSLKEAEIIKDKVTYNIEKMKEYFVQYFYPLQRGNYLFVDGDDMYEIDYGTLNRTFLKALPPTFATWFLTEYRKRFVIVCDSKKPAKYDNYINTFAGYRHERKPYNEFSPEIKKKVNILLRYIKDVLSKGKEENYEYLLNWFANMVQGNKNQSVLYLKGPEGIGKSTITEFFRDHVLKLKACVTAGSDELLTSYNKPLMGALLVSFEELPVFTTQQWQGVSSRLKNMVTNKFENYTDKYERKIMNILNLNNYMILANVEAIQCSQGRRYYILDISTEHQGEEEYWKDLHKQCFHDEVGSAFYNLLCERDVTNFNSQKFPDTDAKRQAIVERLPYEYRFLKFNYIYPKRSIIKTSVDDLYNEYLRYMKCNEKQPSNKMKFCAIIREIGIDFQKSNGYNRYDVPFSKLEDIAQKKKWLHELDDVDPFSEPSPSALDTKDQNIQDLLDKLSEKNEEIAKLKQMLEQLEQKQTQPKPTTKRYKFNDVFKSHEEIMKKVDTVLRDVELCLERNKPIKKRAQQDPFDEDEEDSYECDENMLLSLVSEFNN